LQLGYGCSIDRRDAAGAGRVYENSGQGNARRKMLVACHGRTPGVKGGRAKSPDEVQGSVENGRGPVPSEIVREDPSFVTMHATRRITEWHLHPPRLEQLAKTCLSTP